MLEKNGNSLRITVRLMQASSGAYLFSIDFDKSLKEPFTVQQQVSEQVAAALRLSLVHKNSDYSSALSRLDHLGVEQLVIARKQLSTHTEKSIKQAFERLHRLNQRYPDTPEIIGLLALTHQMLAHTSKDNINETQSLMTQKGLLQTSVRLASQTLALDPTNFDALKTLYYNHSSIAGLREQAYTLIEALLRHHPDKMAAHRASLNLMVADARPCQEIQAFVRDIPTGVFTQHRLTVINTLLEVCLQSKPFEALSLIKDTIKSDAVTDNRIGVSTAKINKAINNNLYLFEIRHDSTFDAIKSRIHRTSIQFRLNDYHWLTLLAGAFDAMVSSEKLIDDGGFWHWKMSLYKTLYDMPTNFKASHFKVSEHGLFTHMIAKTTTVHILAAVLIKQSKQADNTRILTDYLSGMNTFPISLINKNEAIALMMLQYHSGQVKQSQRNGKKLFDKLSIYYQEDPHSFKFWGLGNYYLIAKFHCGQQCQLPDDLQQAHQQAHQQDRFKSLFKSDHAFWMDDIAFTRVALSPWANEPVVVEYLAYIEQDRVRFREKRGL